LEIKACIGVVFVAEAPSEFLDRILVLGCVNYILESMF